MNDEVRTGRDNPIGIMPRWLYIEQRLNKLNEVMQSYIDKNIAVPSEWVEEYIDLRNKYDEIQRKKSISMKGERNENSRTAFEV